MDSAGYNDVKIMLLNPGPSEIQRTLGSFVMKHVNDFMKEKRISVVVNAVIKDV